MLELLSFLLGQKGKAKREDVRAYFSDKYPVLGMGLSSDEYLRMIEAITSMSVGAEWVKRAGFWAVTKHGEQAYNRFKNPKILFQEMAVQSVFRESSRISNKYKTTQLLGWAVLILLPAFCIYSGLASSNPYLIGLAIGILPVMIFSMLFYKARTRLIFLSRILFIESVILSFILLLGSIFLKTSVQAYFPNYFLSILIMQGISTAFILLFPRIVSKTHDYVINRIWFLIIPIMILGILFGGRYGTKGLLYFMYGRDISNIFFTVIFGGVSCIGLLFVFGGAISRLERIGYFD